MNLNEVFWTFQGEGTHAGRRALFVRMPYCNLKCEWCDTEFNSFVKWTRGKLEEVACQDTAKFAVITGGEPMMNKHTPKVIEILRELDFEISCETNGTYPILDGIHFATVSPKRQTYPAMPSPYYVCDDAMRDADEFKYVVDDKFDFSILDRHNTEDIMRTYSLSPEFSTMDESLAKITDYIQRNPGWRISLQTHKWTGFR